MPANVLLLLAAAGLVPIALSYGIAPSRVLPGLIGVGVEGAAQTHVFRAVMGLYLANAAFWVAGALLVSLRRAALWCLTLFMFGLAAGRILSLVLDGWPGMVLVVYLGPELVFCALGLRCLLRDPMPTGADG